MATGRLLLWTLLLGGLQDSVSHGPRMNVGKDYEVVRPIRLHSVNKRDTEGLRPQSVKYALTVGGRPLEMHLERNDELLTKDYSETHYLEDGTRVTTTPNHIDNCYYQGKIMGDEGSQASISTCDGLSGYFQTSAQKYLISPLTSEPEGDHAVTPVTEEKGATPSTCGVTNNTWATEEEPPGRARSSGLAIVFEQKYVELYLVVDYTEFIRLGRDMAVVKKRIFEVVNFVNMAYKPLLTFVALVGLEVWTDKNKIYISSNTNQNLLNFRDWRNRQLTNKQHDAAHLISGTDFEGGTVGLAYVGAMCGAFSVGVVEDHADDVAAVGATLAHELGHNLGMSHDSSSCPCAGDNCIMEPTVKSCCVPRAFSSCSSDNYKEYLTSRSVNCLLDKPLFNTLVAPNVCGNGFVEEGELCDCGSEKECSNPCCNPLTCKLSAGSQCATGECCENCKILPRSRECRGKQDECDSAEYCDGVSAVCPEDVFAANGSPCLKGQGYCYNGECPQRLNQCRKMFGPGATEGKPKCFNFNTRGDVYGYCRRTSWNSYSACAQQDVLCGRLYCHNGNQQPSYGGWVMIDDCKGTYFNDITKDFSLVETGTKCGDGKMCIQNKCVDLQSALKTADCSAKCPGHSMCDSRGQCQCEPGWLPPYCDSKDTGYSSVDPGNLSPSLLFGSINISFILLSVIVSSLWPF